MIVGSCVGPRPVIKEMIPLCVEKDDNINKKEEGKKLLFGNEESDVTSTLNTVRNPNKINLDNNNEDEGEEADDTLNTSGNCIII